MLARMYQNVTKFGDLLTLPYLQISSESYKMVSDMDLVVFLEKRAQIKCVLKHSTL